MRQKHLIFLKSQVRIPTRSDWHRCDRWRIWPNHTIPIPDWTGINSITQQNNIQTNSIFADLHRQCFLSEGAYPERYADVNRTGEYWSEVETWEQKEGRGEANWTELNEVNAARITVTLWLLLILEFFIRH